VLKLGVSSSGTVEITHITTAPFVYLDHWALQKIAKTARDRFVEALQRHNGTLALSWINFLHISEASGETLDVVEALLRRVIPGNVIFIDVEPATVIEKENALTRGESGHMPYVHQDWTDLLFKWKKERSLNPLHPDEFLEAFRSPSLRAGLRATYEEGRKTIAEMVGEARGHARRSPEIQQRLKSPPRREHKGLLPPTRYFNSLAMKYLVRGNQDLARGDHVRDFWHTVVPISYCHYVALDKNWQEAATQFQNVLRRGKILGHEAQVFRDHELLLGRLEGPQPDLGLWQAQR
jgi:hypothetical protein